MTDPPFIGPVEAPNLHVMSFNIRRRMRHLRPGSPDRWDRRRAFVKRLLESERPTLLGMQEALPDQAGFVRHALGEGYRSIGYGRNADRRGEGCPLFYEAERLTLLRWKQTALSDTPDRPGSMTWGNRVPRIMLDATFLDRSTGLEFRVINTHLDHWSRRSRVRAAEVVRGAVAASSVPTLVTGDFNTGAGSLPWVAITAGGTLEDSWDTASERLGEGWGTFPNYREPGLDRKRIDWILATPSITVLRAGTNVARVGGGWPSDHAPVQAVVAISACRTHVGREAAEPERRPTTTGET